MSTEDFDRRYSDLEIWPALDALIALHDDQISAVKAVRPALPSIADAAAQAAIRLSQEGRLVYVGAGTSARIGVQDGVELTPTFSWPEERTIYLVAGGDDALMRAVEGAEDQADIGRLRLMHNQIGASDVVIGLAASGCTPFTVSVVEQAKTLGALTIGISNNRDTPLLRAADHPILIETGAEAVAGSTRMKAGTAQKVVCNLFSTLLMMKLGRVYRGRMVDMQASNDKLRSRATRMVGELTDRNPEDAEALLEAAGGDLKLAIILASGFSVEAGAAALAKHDGNIRLALVELDEAGQRCAVSQSG